MMLSDTKLLKKLKESLAQMAAPLQEDARIFQSKITEASERLEVCNEVFFFFGSDLATVSFALLVLFGCIQGTFRT